METEGKLCVADVSKNKASVAFASASRALIDQLQTQSEYQMEHAVESVIRKTLNASNEGRIHFGQVVGNLVSAGVESYTVDYRAGRAIYYMPCGDTLTLEQALPKSEIAAEFSSAAIKEAILGAQRGEVMYPQFKQLSQAAGCVGYTVWLAGRHVTYYGRKGETHVERFPD